MCICVYAHHACFWLKKICGFLFLSITIFLTHHRHTLFYGDGNSRSSPLDSPQPIF